MPHLQALVDQYRSDVQVIAISFDALSSDSELRSYANRRGLTFPVAAHDRALVIDTFRVRSQSSAIGIDASGIIALRKGYGTQNAAAWREWMDTLAGR